MPNYSTEPFAEAVKYLQGKISVPTNGWRDSLDAAHDAAFVVAGAKGSLLAGIRSITEQALTEGWALDRFQARFKLVTDGWSGNSPWRARVIFQTNLRQAYAAGRYSYQLAPSTLEKFPYFQFVHSDHSDFRPLHKALDGKIFKATEIPFALPSGFGCACRYTSLSEEALGDRKVTELTSDDLLEGIPVQPEPGFDYTPGQTSAARRRAAIGEVLKRLPPQDRQSVEAEIEQLDRRYKQAAELAPTLEALDRSELEQRLGALEALDDPSEEDLATIAAIRALLFFGGSTDD